VNLSIRLPNKEQITAPTEEWLAAVISVLSDEQRRALFHRMGKRLVAYATPGSHILRAEGLDMILDGKR
jgi:hypothetical protein